MDEPRKQLLMTSIRTLIATIGTIIGALGWASESTIQVIVGAIGAAVPIGIELWVSFKSGKKTEEKAIEGVNAGLAHAHETTPEGVVVPQVTDKEAKNIIQSYEQNK